MPQDSRSNVPSPPFSEASPSVSLAAPAKVNAGLHILERRPDGFHEIETVFLPLSWADRVEASPSATLSLTCDDPALPTGPGNLVWDAADALARATGRPPRGHFHLRKRVPYGAGLGSGSSDAAAALRAAAALWGETPSDEVLRRLAAELGSDVPFFLHPVPSVGRGRGERLSPLQTADGHPYRCPFTLVVVVVPVHVSTAWAYRQVTPSRTSRPDLARALLSDDLDRWTRELQNDFEPAVTHAYPVVRAALDALTRAGAGYAALSGSGAAVLGAFASDADAVRAADEARARGDQVWVERPDGGPRDLLAPSSAA